MSTQDSEAGNREFIVTFGSQHGTTERHPFMPEAHRDGYVSVWAPDGEEARRLILARLADWSNMYDPAWLDANSPRWKERFPMGRLANLYRDGLRLTPAGAARSGVQMRLVTSAEWRIIERSRAAEQEDAAALAEVQRVKAQADAGPNSRGEPA